MKKNKIMPAKIGAIFLVSVMSMAAIGAGYAHWQETLTISGVMTTDDIYPYFAEAISNDPVEENNMDPAECGEWIYGDNGWCWDGVQRDKNVGYYNVGIHNDDQSLGIKMADAYPCYYAHPMFIIKNKGSCPVLIHSIRLIELSFEGTSIPLQNPIDLEPNQVWGIRIDHPEGATPTADVHQPVVNADDDFSIMLTGSEMIINKQLDPESWKDGTGHMANPSDYCDEIQGDLCIHFENGCEQDVVYDLKIDLVFYNWPEFCTPQGCEISKTYTLDADFDEGTLTNVNYDIVHDQLQLDEVIDPLPFIWVPNSNEGTVSKYDTDTGYELARYWTGPMQASVIPNPSRTTVDQEGSVWFGNRGTGTVVKIGLYEMGNWIDKNGNGVCDTSTDLNSDHDVYGSEILPWNTDECVLFETLIGASNSGVRGLAVDSNNDLWAGTHTLPGGNKFYHVDGDTGSIITADTIDISPYSAYGAVIDEDGNLWCSCGPSVSPNTVLKINTATKAVTPITLNNAPYGLGVDGNGHVFVSSWGTSGIMARIDINTLNVIYGAQGASYSRGVALTDDGDVWVVNSLATQVTRVSNDLSTVKATIDIGSNGYSTGVAVDSNGKVWACNFDDGNLNRIDPATNTIDLTKHTPGYTGTGNGQHYSYSDMTGKISIGTTVKLGYWTVDFDSTVSNANWGIVSWNSLEPTGTEITVRVRSKENLADPWSAWEDVTNGSPLSSTPAGRYIQIEVKFKIESGEVSPVLYDLTVKGNCN